MEYKYIDLLYFGYEWDKDSKAAQAEFIDEIKCKFLDVELRNAFDDIKGYRQEVHLPESEHDNYYAWLFAKDFFDYSMTIQLLMMSYNQPEEKAKFIKYLDLAKEQYPESFKS